MSNQHTSALNRNSPVSETCNGNNNNQLEANLRNLLLQQLLSSQTQCQQQQQHHQQRLHPNPHHQHQGHGGQWNTSSISKQQLSCLTSPILPSNKSPLTLSPIDSTLLSSNTKNGCTLPNKIGDDSLPFSVDDNFADVNISLSNYGLYKLLILELFFFLPLSLSLVLLCFDGADVPTVG